MPRIQATTVVENRDLRRTALLRAARELFLVGGDSAVTMSAAALSAGLSRPAAYEYFPSSSTLLHAFVDGQAERWTTTIQDALRNLTEVRDVIRVFVETSMPILVGDAPPSGLSSYQVDRFHSGPVEELARVLGTVHLAHPGVIAHLIGGAVVAATRTEERGEDLVVTMTRLLTHGLDGLSANRSPG
jgi:AcrR family transcriptional regulator